MSDRDEIKAKVNAHFHKKGVETIPCALCGQWSEWGVTDGPVVLPRIDRGKPSTTQGYPVQPMTCPVCGYVFFLSAEIIGLD